MNKKLFSISCSVLMVGMLALSACQPIPAKSKTGGSASSGGDAMALAGGTTSSSNDTQSQDGGTTTSSDASNPAQTANGTPGSVSVVSNNGETANVPVSPSLTEVVEPGRVAKPDIKTTVGPNLDPNPPVPALDKQYSEATYKFSLSYPSSYVVRTRTTEQLAVLAPKPVAAFMFMNPVAAASTVPDEPGDLEVRIYQPEGGSHTLGDWLKTSGLLPEGTDITAMYKPQVTDGVQVCRSDMMAPACSTYYFANGFVYQVIPMSQAGDLMLATFKVTP